jgi:hypothetical protein
MITFLMESFRIKQILQQCTHYCIHREVNINKIGLLAIRIMYPGIATCLPTDCCCSSFTPAMLKTNVDIHINLYKRASDCSLTPNEHFFCYIMWRSVLLVEETEVPGENHRPVKVADKRYHIMLYQVHTSSI